MRCWHTCHNNIVIAGAHAKCNSWKCLSNLLHKVRILLLQQLCHYLNVSNLMNILLRLKKKRWENNETNKQINKYQQQQKKKNSITYMEYLAFVFAMINPCGRGSGYRQSLGQSLLWQDLLRLSINNHLAADFQKVFWYH